MSAIDIYRVSDAGGTYGPPIDADEFPGVSDAVENEVIARDEDTGEVFVGGLRYRWERR